MQIHQENINGLAVTLYGEWSASREPSATGMNTATKWNDLPVREHERWRVVAATAIRMLVTAFDQHLHDTAEEMEVIIDGEKSLRNVVDITELNEG